MKRGEIRWYKFNKPDKKRPVLILTRNSVIEYLNEITIAPITSTVRDIPSDIYVGICGGVCRRRLSRKINFDLIMAKNISSEGSFVS